MANYIFDPSGIGQRGVFTHSTLDPKEFEMMEAVVNWNSPERSAEYIRQLYGRSIVFKSPTRECTIEDYVNNRFDGLQLIAAGGNLQCGIRGGEVEVLNGSDEIPIYPADPKNHAAELSDLTEFRFVDKTGQLAVAHRRYVPLNGMDQHEAKSRKLFTQHFYDIVMSGRLKGVNLGIIVPELVAEGKFPDYKDLEGKCLPFQVYRVPLIKRIPGQLIDFYATHSESEFVNYIQEVSRKVGYFLRGLHKDNFVYRDSSSNNMSHLLHGGNSILYVTDLGSMGILDDTDDKQGYFALDTMAFLLSMNYSVRGLMMDRVNESNIPEVAENLRVAIESMTQAFFLGYYQDKINRQDESNRAHTVKKIKNAAILFSYGINQMSAENCFELFKELDKEVNRIWTPKLLI